MFKYLNLFIKYPKLVFNSEISRFNRIQNEKRYYKRHPEILFKIRWNERKNNIEEIVYQGYRKRSGKSYRVNRGNKCTRYDNNGNVTMSISSGMGGVRYSN